ncbi:hypothetical protein [Lichenihabitans psoromatis]|uniref:hypothetical protein n=1 Tax=Lichenihabitans psoromatis TaxID=2528642 RepID=UPI001035A7D3|nr:hypothetical protein [Lichenihabitans psoromatis]
MPDPSDPHRDIELFEPVYRPDVQVLPHLSAPIDEGQFFPNPPLRFSDILQRVLMVAAVILAGFMLIFARGIFFH